MAETIFHEKQYALLAIAEAEYGTFNTNILPATHTIECMEKPGVSYPHASEPRGYYGGVMGAIPHYPAARHAEFTFKTHLYGVAAGVATRLSPLWQGCGLDEDISAGVSVTHHTLSAAFESTSIEIWEGDIRHRLSGGMGDVNLVFESGMAPYAEWHYWGIGASVNDAGSFPTLTFEDYEVPIVGSGTTVSFFGKTDFLVKKLSINLGNTVVKRHDAGGTAGLAGFVISGREVSGELTCEVDASDEYAAELLADWLDSADTQLSDMTYGPIGQTAGNKFTVTGTNMQPKVPPVGSIVDGILCYVIPFKLVPATGDDDLVVAIT